MRDFRQLKVWTKAHELTLEIYRVTSRFPKEELYGITSQMRRCSASIRQTSRKDADGAAMGIFIAS